jgi:hypothetical protein
MALLIRRVFLLAAFISCLAYSTAGQLSSSNSQDSADQSNREQAGTGTSHCQSIAGSAEQTPLVNACKFALTFRRQLPDFVCQQTTTSIGPRWTIVMNAQVTFEKGREHYSDVTVETKPSGVNPAAAIREMKFLSAGELGSDLVGLFTAPISRVFEFWRQRRYGQTVLIYRFHLAAESNRFWALQDSRRITIHPELGGELWIESKSNRVLRLELRPLRLPKDFEFVEVNIATDYSEVTISDAGTFLLPYRSENERMLPALYCGFTLP